MGRYVPNFGCRVSQGGTKSFVVQHGADRQLITIGRYPVVSLADAREEAKRILAEWSLADTARAQRGGTTRWTNTLLFARRRTGSALSKVIPG